MWSLYRRSYGRWALDYNAADDSWSGTVAYSRADASSVTAVTRWSVGSMRVVQAAVASPPTPPPPVAVAMSAVAVSGAGLPYESRTTGVYRPTGGSFGGAPVYSRTDGHGLTWSLYRRSGRWVIDFNEVDHRWSGTVAYSRADASASALGAAWGDRAIVLTAAPATAAATVSDGATTNNKGGAPPEAPHEEPLPPKVADEFHTSELAAVQVEEEEERDENAEEAPIAIAAASPSPASPPHALPPLSPTSDVHAPATAGSPAANDDAPAPAVDGEPSHHSGALSAEDEGMAPGTQTLFGIPLSVVIAGSAGAAALALALIMASVYARRRRCTKGANKQAVVAAPGPIGVLVASSGDVEVRVADVMVADKV